MRLFVPIPLCPTTGHHRAQPGSILFARLLILVTFPLFALSSCFTAQMPESLTILVAFPVLQHSHAAPVLRTDPDTDNAPEVASPARSRRETPFTCGQLLVE